MKPDKGEETVLKLRFVGVMTMTSEPTPRHASDADAAEARLKQLHRRFEKVSQGLDGRGGGFSFLPLSRFEMLILLGVMAFAAIATTLFFAG